jgi:hypothetical protein
MLIRNIYFLKPHVDRGHLTENLRRRQERQCREGKSLLLENLTYQNCFPVGRQQSQYKYSLTHKLEVTWNFGKSKILFNYVSLWRYINRYFLIDFVERWFFPFFFQLDSWVWHLRFVTSHGSWHTYISYQIKKTPVPAAERSKAWIVFARSVAVIVGLNPT